MSKLKRGFLLLPLVLLLAGCFQDAASYTFPERDHAITLVRNQTWPWQSGVEVEVMALRLPECSGGGSIQDVDRHAAMTLYRAPEAYTEAEFLLRVDTRVYAVSTQSCTLQRLDTIPADLGRKLGRFQEVDGTFQYLPAQGV